MTTKLAVALLALVLVACDSPVAPKPAPTMAVQLTDSVAGRPAPGIGTEPVVCHDRRMADPHTAECVRIPLAAETP